jgi:acetylornithine deacetylase/succinyl-diaminopimelate desuccinylase-like protein
LCATEPACGRRAVTGQWDFGTYWVRQAGIPTIGFGPSNEAHTHIAQEQVRLDDVVPATRFYALLPALLLNR